MVGTKGFSFWVDSNKIFFSPQKPDTIKYGILPDSIFQLIDKTILKIISDTTIKSRDDGGCEDCSIVAIQSVIGNDTITIHQVGKIDKIFLPVIKKLREFIDSSDHTTIYGTILLQANKIAFPPPLPPIPNGKKFLPPI